MEPIAVLFIIFGSVGAITWKFLEERHKERMAMIEKGTKPDDLRSKLPLFRISPLSTLKWGLFFLFIGLGIGTASYLNESLGWDDAVYPAMMFTFGGGGLIIFYFIAKSKIDELGG